MPILEPEVDIRSPDKAQSEELLKQNLLAGLESLPAGQQVMFKLSSKFADWTESTAARLGRGDSDSLKELADLFRSAADTGSVAELGAWLERQPD